MERHEKALTNTHRKCQLCLKQTTSDCIFTDVAHYAPETGNLTIVSRLACARCRQQILTIRQYVEENALNFSKNSSVFQENIQPYLPKEGAMSINVENSIFQKSIQQQIKRNKLHYCARLPQNCLQLVYYSSFSINHAQRHQRIRNTISEVMRVSSIPYGNLEDVAVLVHCLSCYMHENNIVFLLKHISQRILLEGSPISPSNIFSDLPTQRIWKQLYSDLYIGNIILIIGAMLRDWKNFEMNFQKLRQQRQYLKKQKLASILTLNQSSPILKKKLTHDIQINNHENQNGCKQCARNRLFFLVNEAKTKNAFALTLKTLLKQDQALREHISQVQAKFLKEKEQFINKIIKLKDKIQVLEHPDDCSPFENIRRARSSSDHGYKKSIYKSDLEQVEQKSQKTSRTYELVQKMQENGFANEADKSKNPQIVKKQNYLQKIVVNIPEFDPSFLSEESNDKFLAQQIENSIIKMKDDMLSLEKKNRALENQSKRLLSILTRKQQRFIPLIHQKDEIIQKYENALWRMEHNMPVEDPSLAPRIQSIISVFKNDFMENLTNGTLESDRNIQDFVTPVKSVQKKQKKKKRQSERKLKSDEKQCTIF